MSGRFHWVVAGRLPDGLSGVACVPMWPPCARCVWGWVRCVVADAMRGWFCWFAVVFAAQWVWGVGCVGPFWAIRGGFRFRKFLWAGADRPPSRACAVRRLLVLFGVCFALCRCLANRHGRARLAGAEPASMVALHGHSTHCATCLFALQWCLRYYAACLFALHWHLMKCSVCLIALHWHPKECDVCIFALH